MRSILEEDYLEYHRQRDKELLVTDANLSWCFVILVWVLLYVVAIV